MDSITASEFKAKCLAILDTVNTTGERIIITKRGRPVAELMPYVSRNDGAPQAGLIDSGRIIGDIESPVVPSSNWKSAGSG